MPLFSSKDDTMRDVPHEPYEDAAGEAEGEAAPPSEHTRLLPNRIDSSRPVMLSPDDPAVSPYNLWTIRVLRWLTIVFTLVTFVWWVILLVSAFATPPGFHTRGSGFFAFSYASLTLANMLFTLVFFGIPSRAVRILAAIMAFTLAINMILILSIQMTRYEEGWVGATSVIWALLMSLWTLITDRTVKWGKEEEEERLTGRAETRRTVTEWTMVLLSTIAYVIMTIAVVLITLSLILRGLDAAVAPPGKMYWVDSGNYRVHLYCHGNKTDSDGRKLPTVLLEGGERPVEDGLWAFADDAIKNGSISRYCFADRPGFAWSDTSPSPLSASFAVDALSEALAQADETGPWILASAGIGSLYSRVFSSRHGEAVHGLLLIDPLHEDLLGEVASASRGFWLWVRGVLSPLGLDRLPGAILRGRTTRDRIYGRSAQQTGKYIFARLQESLVAGSFTKRDVESSRQIQRRGTPLVVVSSGEQIKKRKGWEAKQRDLTALTDNLKQWTIVDGAPHRVWETREGRGKIEKALKKLVGA
jgi:pimeloyl-ACP methyl ester carboxylesterase